VRILNQDVVRRLGISDDYVEQITAQELAEVRRRLRYFRGQRPEEEGEMPLRLLDALGVGVVSDHLLVQLAGPHAVDATGGRPVPGTVKS